MEVHWSEVWVYLYIWCSVFLQTFLGWLAIAEASPNIPLLSLLSPLPTNFLFSLRLFDWSISQMAILGHFPLILPSHTSFTVILLHSHSISKPCQSTAFHLLKLSTVHFFLLKHSYQTTSTYIHYFLHPFLTSHSPHVEYFHGICIRDMDIKRSIAITNMHSGNELHIRCMWFVRLGYRKETEFH